MIIDSHAHLFESSHYDRLLKDMKCTGVDKFVLQDMGCFGSDPSRNQLRNGIMAKTADPDSVFLFGGLDYSGMYDSHRDTPDVPFDTQIEILIDSGCDGVKMLFGKPDLRQAVGKALDSEVFEPLLQCLEETRFPVLWHVSDPAEFWDESTVPQWARLRKWWYDKSVPPKEQIDREIQAVFKRHPRLNLVLPHFFFLSDDFASAARFLETYPSFSIDLAPGVEWLHNSTAQYEKARAFFCTYADRILFGTDMGMAFGWSPERGMMIRKFLETTERFPVPDDPAMAPDDRPMLHGLGLPAGVLDKIYCANFHRFAGVRPRKLKTEKLRCLIPSA